MAKLVYFFGGGKADGKGIQKGLLGGKGAGLAEMSKTGVPVPPGFTITTEVCSAYYSNNKKFPKELKPQILKAIKKVEMLTGNKFGSMKNPLLVSVRSGAKFSMPGMMDTILNLGLNDKAVEGLASKTKNIRFAYDSYRRFIQMFSDVVMGVAKSKYEEILDKYKKREKVSTDIQLSPDSLKRLVLDYKRLYKKCTRKDFPQDPLIQLDLAINAVFKSWNNERAITYRNLYNIPHSLGTAVNVQTMVFGNMGNTSATGVGFTRNPSTGERKFYGEYLINAQGEDVVAGIRTPKPISQLQKEMPKVYTQLKKITQKLEKHYKDVQDFEFTVQDSKLYMLQTRVGKRTGFAAVKIAVDMVKEKLISPEVAVSRVGSEQLEQLLHPIFDREARKSHKVIAVGLNASPGAATGKVVFSADDAVSEAQKGASVILVREETSPDDVHGMHAARGVLTATGGMTSHAAVVGRQMGRPSVVGCGAIKVNEKAQNFKVDKRTVKKGDFISIDGTTGEVMYGNVPTRDSEILQVLNNKIKPQDSKLYKYFATIMKYTDKVKKLDVRANADTPRDASMAIKLGAVGIGLCRTEHMFFAEDRIPLVQKMILASDEKNRKEAIRKLLPLQRKDFEGIFKVMRGNPVTIRTLDPPLHEFLPKKEELLVEIAQMELKKVSKEKIQEKKKLLSRVLELSEFNPMLGHRGCRLGITFPMITEMQATAIFEAACKVKKSGINVKPEIMIPLVGHINELKNQREIIRKCAKAVLKKKKVNIKYTIGTMIEIPRAALTADQIAEEAEFFSFGTNDLTQMTFGYSRDDAGKFLKYYKEKKILPSDPFVSIDEDGIGQLIKICVAKGRKSRPGIKLGICGEQGGDPKSILFCHKMGLNYVSCSPFRVPVAKLAAAHAFLIEKNKM